MKVTIEVPDNLIAEAINAEFAAQLPYLKEKIQEGTRWAFTYLESAIRDSVCSAVQIALNEAVENGLANAFPKQRKGASSIEKSQSREE